MSTISLRLPNSLHDSVRDLAQKENISINQLITLAIAEKVSALMTQDYLAQRAERGNREKFYKALSKVENIEPAEMDRL